MEESERPQRDIGAVDVPGDRGQRPLHEAAAKGDDWPWIIWSIS
jgi:hypothetical protein